MGASRLSRLEIRAWEEDECRQLQPWERKAILVLDTHRVAALNAPRKT